MFDRGQKYINACMGDGWTKEQIYPGSEVQKECVRLDREGFSIHIYCYEYNGKVHRDIAAWGPDRLALELPEEYNWEQMKANLNLCSMCGKRGEVVSLGFAGRVCMECRKANVARVEYPGWCN